MTCPNCGRYEPPDPETGYDVDSWCPDCVDEEERCARDEDADRRREEEYDAALTDPRRS